MGCNVLKQIQLLWKLDRARMKVVFCIFSYLGIRFTSKDSPNKGVSIYRSFIFRTVKFFIKASAFISVLHAHEVACAEVPHFWEYLSHLGHGPIFKLPLKIAGSRNDQTSVKVVEHERCLNNHGQCNQRWMNS